MASSSVPSSAKVRHELHERRESYWNIVLTFVGGYVGRELGLAVGLFVGWMVGYRD